MLVQKRENPCASEAPLLNCGAGETEVAADKNEPAAAFVLVVYVL